MRMFLFTLAAGLALAMPSFAEDAKILGRFDAVGEDDTELVAARYRAGYRAGYYGRPGYGASYRYNSGYNYGYASRGYYPSYYAPRSYYNYSYNYRAPSYYYAPRYYGGWCGISDTADLAAVVMTLKNLVEPVAPVTRNDPLNQRFQPPVELPAPQVTPAKPVEDLKVSLPAAKGKYQFKAYGEK